MKNIGAFGGNRTPTTVRTTDFESVASTSSATKAYAGRGWGGIRTHETQNARWFSRPVPSTARPPIPTQTPKRPRKLAFSFIPSPARSRKPPYEFFKIKIYKEFFTFSVMALTPEKQVRAAKKNARFIANLRNKFFTHKRKVVYALCQLFLHIHSLFIFTKKKYEKSLKNLRKKPQTCYFLNRNSVF